MAESLRKKPGSQARAVLEGKMEIIRHAILQREAIAAAYQGHMVTLYPHALGWRGGKQFLLALVDRPGDADARRRASPWEWVCIRHLRSVATQPGRWRTGDRPPTDLLDLIEAVSQ